MRKIHFSIQIQAPQEKVWHTMLDQATYREWTKPFNPGSHYVGNLEEEGATIHFLGSDESGNPQAGGMYSKIKESRPYEFLSIEHLGFVMNGVVDTTSEEVKKWTPAFENYTFTEKDDGTEVGVDIELNDEHVTEFEAMWPQALELLKELAESN